MMAIPPQPAFDPFAVFDEPRREFHLSRWWEVVKRRGLVLLAVATAFVVFALIAYLRTPKAYRATAVMQVERRVLGPVKTDELFESWWDAQAFFPTQLQLLRSRGLAERVVGKLGLVSSPQLAAPAPAGHAGAVDSLMAEQPDIRTVRAAYGLLANLTVSEITGTRMIRIAFVSGDPAEAARVVNAFVDAYSEWGIEQRTASINKANTYLRTQVDELKDGIKQGEERLQAYSQRQDVVAVDTAVKVTSARFEQLQEEYLAAVSERILRERALGGTAAAGANGGTAAPGATPPPAADPASAQDRRAYESALAQERLLADEVKRQKQELMRLNVLAIEYAALKGEVTSRKSLLDELLRRQAEIDLASGLREESSVTVVERALPAESPFRPSLFQNLSLGLGLGLVFGLLGVLAAEYLDRTIKSPEDIDRFLRLSVLGSIPDLEEGGQRYGYYGYGYGQRRRRARDAGKKLPSGTIPPELVSVHHPRIGISEAYRSLRTAVLLSSADTLKTVLVTSAVAGEGKTVTASNLAAVLAQIGRSVLLVDADLRKPRQHEIFRVSNRVGLVSFLTRQAEIAEVTLPTAIEGLSLVPSGPLPPQPAELLDSERMREFLVRVRDDYDFVIVDSPPVVPVTDAVVLSSVVDGVLLCIGAGQAVREEVAACVERLAMVDAKVLGGVLNRIRREGGSYRNKYYYYHYGSSDAKPEPDAPAGA
jgi:polysaccharide biosynthesis transport protein